jgi:hypothetical protein
MTPQRKVHLPILLLMVTLLPSCATHQGYSGPPLQRNAVATLHCAGLFGGVRLEKVDDKPVHVSSGSSITLLPGPHKLIFYTSTPNVTSNFGIIREIEVEAGHTYYAKLGTSGSGIMRPGISYPVTCGVRITE